ATYYDPNGGTGACGSVLQNKDFIVALGTGNWAGGAHCGQTVNVTVQDLCPGCQGARSLGRSHGGT
ncbi:hypothetical protein B0H14DRAFT_2382194, partial [Mycena olivaceomarginata]